MSTNDVPSSLTFSPCSQALPGMEHAIDACVKVAELNARTWREVVDRWQLDAAAVRGGKFDVEEILGLQEWFVEQSLLYGRHLQDIVTQAGHATGQSGVPALKESQERWKQLASGGVGYAAPGFGGAEKSLQTLFAAMNESTRRMLDAFKGSDQTTR